MSWSLQNVPLPARLRPPVPLSDEELMAFSEANKPCRVERLASGEILVMTPSGFENNRREPLEYRTQGHTRILARNSDQEQNSIEALRRILIGESRKDKGTK